MNFSGLFQKIDRLFVLTVIVPTLCAIGYYGLIASDVYISESRFVVRSPDKPSASGLGVILKSAGFTNAGEEIEAAKEFITSRDALMVLNRGKRVERAYGSPAISIFDRFDPLGMDGSFERLHKYFSSKVTVAHDSASSVTTLTVRAYTAADAARFNRELLEQSEALVNRLNERGRKDLIGYAQTEVDEARREAERTAMAMATYRNRTGVVDPERQAAVQLQMISKLQDELIGAQNQLSQLEASVPDNPQIPTLKVRIAALSREIDVQLGRVAGDRGSLSATAAQYQRLVLDNEVAGKRLAAAMTSLQEARNEARRKQAYVERIVQPNVPDEALEPRRLRGTLATLLLGLIAWGVLSMLLAGVREHKGKPAVAEASGPSDMGDYPLGKSWAIQCRVVWALLMREVLTRYGRHNIGFMWLFVEPMMFTLGVTALWTATKSVHGSDLPIVAFAITGYSSVLLWRNMPARCIDAIEPNRSLLVHRNVRVIDIYFSRLLLEAAGATISLIVLSLVFIALGQMDPPEDVLQVIAGWLMLAWFGLALAIFLGAASERSETVHKLWHPVSYLMFPLSGAAFLLSAMPPEAQALLSWLPMINGTEYLREGFFGSKIEAIYDMGYMATCNAVLTVLGLAITRVVSDNVIPE